MDKYASEFKICTQDLNTRPVQYIYSSLTHQLQDIEWRWRPAEPLNEEVVLSKMKRKQIKNKKIIKFLLVPCHINM